MMSDHSVLMALLTAIVGTLIVLLLFNRQLKREVHARTMRISEIYKDLQMSEAKYRSLFSENHDAILLIDVDGLNIMDANEASVRLYGYSREELLNHNILQISAEPEVTKIALENAATETGRFVPLRWHLKKNGARFPVEISLIPFRWNHQQVVCAVNRDITDRIRYEEEMKIAREYAEKANQLKSQFLANMSHEIRTPMNVVLGTVELLSRSHTTPEQKEFLKTIEQSGNHLLEIINAILDLSKLDSGIELHETVFDLHECVSATLHMLKAQADKKNIPIVYRFGAHVPRYITADQTRVRQLLLNLVGNAVKFTNTGEIAVAIIVQQQQQERVELQFSVSDSGIGIPEDKISLLFNPFTQLDSSLTRQYSGTGLGLAISKRLAEAMGGKIWVESEQGKGSVFFFCIQVKIPETVLISPITEATVEPEANDEDPVAETIRILVVEDNPDNQTLIHHFITLAGYSAEFAGNGKEALAAVSGTNYDLVLMDIQMPEMDGLEATRQIRQRDPENPKPYIVAMTAHAMVEHERQCIEAGMNDYLNKPLTIDSIQKIIHKYQQKIMVRP
ncbi:MAG: response regulator [SAR324 cluster bacterium]|nr:response regulator [SAR324 cluster bacterium]